MNRKELADMAYEATVVSHVDAFYPMTIEALEHFANLVAEKEREACAIACESVGKCTEVEAISNAFAAHIRARGQK